MREVLSARSMNLPGLREPPAFVVNQRGIGEADQVQRAGLDLAEKIRWGCRCQTCARVRRADEQIEPVQFLPQFNA